MKKYFVSYMKFNGNIGYYEPEHTILDQHPLLWFKYKNSATFAILFYKELNEEELLEINEGIK